MFSQIYKENLLDLLLTAAARKDADELTIREDGDGGVKVRATRGQGQRTRIPQSMDCSMSSIKPGLLSVDITVCECPLR